MLFINRLVMIGLLSVGFTFATTAQAAVKLFTATWTTESFGNECIGTMTPGGLPGAECNQTTGEYAAYSNWGMPQGILCNATQPRCPFSSTPTDGKGAFHPLGGPGNPTMPTSINCAALSTYGAGITTRPAKGGTVSPRVPPLYRNPFFFTPGGQPKLTGCGATSTGYFTYTQTRFGADKGKVQRGKPVAGTWQAATTSPGHLAGFNVLPAPPVGQHKAGIRTTGLIGEFTNTYPYIYSYTYATLRNDAGVFGPGQGPGAFVYSYPAGAAMIKVKQGAAKFGGTMKMLGALTTKVCYWLQAGGGGCSLGQNNWLYQYVGAPASTSGGVVTMGGLYTFMTIYYNTANKQTSPLTVSAARFPWTTGSVTLTAVGRGPHKTIHYAQGYDNRNLTTSLGKGTIQMVSPVLTRWLGFVDFETGGIGVLRIKFVPEPQTWAILIAGISLLGVGYRMRGR